MSDRFQKHRDAVEDGLAELEKLAQEKKEIDLEISKLVQIVAANIAILPAYERPSLGIKLEAATPPSGLSDAALRVLSFTNHMTVADVRDALLESGYDLSSQTNALASINTTLRRLAESGRVTFRDINGRNVYKRVATRP